jgi:hypothetical protein
MPGSSNNHFAVKSGRLVTAECLCGDQSDRSIEGVILLATSYLLIMHTAHMIGTYARTQQCGPGDVAGLDAMWDGIDRHERTSHLLDRLGGRRYGTTRQRFRYGVLPRRGSIRLDRSK